MVASKHLFDTVGEDLRRVKVWGIDSMLTVREPGDYEGRDNLGKLMPGTEIGLHDVSYELVRQGLILIILTRGPGYPEVSNILAACTGTSLPGMDFLFKHLEKADNLEAMVNGSKIVMPTYQSTPQLYNEAKEKANAGLFYGIAENGSAAYMFKDGKVVLLNLGGPEIEPALQEIDAQFAKDSFMQRYGQFLTPQYRFSRVWTRQGVTEDELKALGGNVYGIAERVAPGKFQWIQSVPNGRGYLVVNGLDKSKGMELLFNVLGIPFSYDTFGYIADGVLGNSEKNTVVRPYSKTALVALDIVAKGVDPIEPYVATPGDWAVQFKDPLRIYPDVAYVPGVPGLQPAYIAVTNPLAAMFLIREAHRVQPLQKIIALKTNL